MAGLSRTKATGAEPSARCEHAAVGFGQNMFVCAGWNSGVTVSSSVVERFNVLSTAWQEPRHLGGQSLQLPAGMTIAAVASDGKRAYLFRRDKANSLLYCLDLSSLLCREIVPTNTEFSGYHHSAMIYYRQKLAIYGRDELTVLDLNTSESIDIVCVYNVYTSKMVARYRNLQVLWCTLLKKGARGTP